MLKVYILLCADYAQCLPSRFRKEMIQTLAADSSDNSKISLIKLHSVLKNIGGNEEKISKKDLEMIFQGQTAIDVKQLIQYL